MILIEVRDDVLIELFLVTGKEEEARVHQHMHVVAQRQIEDFRLEIQRKEQDLVQMQAKMKTVEEQHADYQRHIAVLKESLIAKEEHYNMLQIDVSSRLKHLFCDFIYHYNKKIQIPFLF